MLDLGGQELLIILLLTLLFFGAELIRRLVSSLGKGHDEFKNGQNFWQHLTELRRCLIRIAIALFLGFLASLFLCRRLLDLLTAPAGQLVFLRPAEAFTAQLKAAMINGIFVSFPITLWQLSRFLWPALYPRERKYVYLLLPFSFLLFGAGLTFGYFGVARLGYPFLLSFATENIRPMISLETYLSFVLSSMLLCGFIFLLPVVVLFLARVGILKTAFLRKQHGIIIVGLAIIAAVVTPTVDAFSMIIVFLPLLALFEFSIFLAWLGERRMKKLHK
ncbi:MAG TPA: twin-arginine translocase subunit TatC [Bacillota bacterium]|nr:twin-arginine translocase subunit TatC [Bacillota bacterium]